MGFGGEFIQILVRGWTFLFTLLSMALVGNAIAIQIYGNQSVNFAMFTSTFAMIVLIVWVVSKFVGLPALVMLGLDAFATIVSLIAGIVLAARLDVHSCNNEAYLFSNSLTQGKVRRCRELQASCAFFWFMFAGFLASTVLDFLHRDSNTLRGSRRSSSAPAMAQV